MYLLDTNVISEYRKKAAANQGVIDFFDQHSASELYLCAQVVGEIQAGIQKLVDEGRTDKAQVYQNWLQNDLLKNYPERVLPFGTDAGQVWGVLNSKLKKDPHTTDRQIAAVALAHVAMSVVTRDVDSPGFKVAQTYGLALQNPFT